MAIGIIKSKEAIGDVIVATVSCEHGETKQIFACLTSMLSCWEYDNLDMCKVGDEIEFLSSCVDSEYGEELNYLGVMK